MISTLHIENIGIIDDLTINFYEGLNILTGETGAGKSLIIQSLNLICGGRFYKEIIRTGKNYSFVEASLYIKNNCKEDNIIVSREIYSNGRNTCRINGRLVTVNELKEFMKNIIDIHGQHENQTLLESDSHINYLDNFIGDDINIIKDKYNSLYKNYRELQRELKENYGDDKEKQRRLDLLKYQYEEIDRASLKIGEEEELDILRKKIKNFEKISENLNIVDYNLSENAIDAINTSIKALEKIEDLDEAYNDKLNNLKNIYYDIQELSRDISSIREDEYFDKDEIQRVDDRLDLIFSLKRKYGNTIEEILNYKEEVEKEIYLLENIEDINNKRKEELLNIEKQMNSLCKELTLIRTNMANVLEKKINKELVDLDMKNAKFLIDLKLKEEYGIKGLDTIEFLISTNVGGEYKSLIKIASGGEMSRIMLAIKTILANIDRVPVLIFDEIDVGISGNAAKMVGEKMKNISKEYQVLCITHLANIAARGDYNYYIYKKVENNETKTSFKELNEEETIEEIARISTGEITNIALEHAKELRYECSFDNENK